MPVRAAIQAGQSVCEEPLPSGPGTVLDPKPTVVRATTAITTTITITTATATQIRARRRYRLPSGPCAYPNPAPIRGESGPRRGPLGRARPSHGVKPTMGLPADDRFLPFIKWEAEKVRGWAQPRRGRRHADGLLQIRIRHGTAPGRTEKRNRSPLRVQTSRTERRLAPTSKFRAVSPALASLALSRASADTSLSG